MITRTCALYGNSRRIIVVIACFSVVLLGAVTVRSPSRSVAPHNDTDVVHGDRT